MTLAYYAAGEKSVSKFSSKPKSGPSAEQIRKEEKAAMDKENLARINEQETNRSKLRQNLLAGEDEDEIEKKKLLGQ